MGQEVADNDELFGWRWSRRRRTKATTRLSQ